MKLTGAAKGSMFGLRFRVIWQASFWAPSLCTQGAFQFIYVYFSLYVFVLMSPPQKHRMCGRGGVVFLFVCLFSLIWHWVGQAGIFLNVCAKERKERHNGGKTQADPGKGEGWGWIGDHTLPKTLNEQNIIWSASVSWIGGLQLMYSEAPVP